jgi:hypothetical protein
MQVTFFPGNKLGATIEPIYNGHTGVITQNTDRLVDGKYALAELNAFKYDIQLSSFLNPYGSTGFPVGNSENVNYGETIKKVHDTGRISFGIYYRTDSWYNPINQQIEIIPSYNSTTWTQASVDAGFDVQVGATKPIRYPNHGQQMYDESNGAYGYDFTTNTVGGSNLIECNLMSEAFISYFKGISGLRLTNMSYTNGEQLMAPLLKPYFIGGRNSEYSWTGDSNIDYNPTRQQAISKASSTRTWDAHRAGRFVNQAQAILYAQGEINKAISLSGWWSDFMHWHSLYNFGDVQFFELFYSGIRSTVGEQDAWMAGYGEALEYLFLRDNIVNIGSYVHDGKVNISVWVRDRNKDGVTDGIPDAIDMSLLKTPISVRVDLTGTILAGKDIICERAHSIRKLGNNVWIVNIPYSGFGEFGGVEIEEGSQHYYDSNKPTLTFSGNTVTANMPSKWVVWRRPASAGIETISEIDRVNEPSGSISIAKVSGYTYYVGAISRSNHSSLIEL